MPLNWFNYYLTKSELEPKVILALVLLKSELCGKNLWSSTTLQDLICPLTGDFKFVLCYVYCLSIGTRISSFLNVSFSFVTSRMQDCPRVYQEVSLRNSMASRNPVQFVIWNQDLYSRQFAFQEANLCIKSPFASTEIIQELNFQKNHSPQALLPTVKARVV